MQWYSGDIAQAVAESRRKNAIFVVFISGNDAASGKLLNMIEESKIRAHLESEHFVAIRIESDSQSYMQFASIYQMAPVPSIFFIGSTGTPIEIGTSIMATSDELEEKIRRALQAHLPKTSLPSTASSSLIAAEKKIAIDKPVTSAAEQQPEPAAGSSLTAEANVTEKSSSTDTEIVCDGEVCYKKPKEKTTTNEVSQAESAHNEAEVFADTVADGSADASPQQQQQPDFNSRLAATRELLAQKRREALEEEKKQEKESELRRRREGKEIQHVQEWQREKELKDLKDNIRRERIEEQQARERIRAQIAADRAERAQRSSTASGPESTVAKEATPKPAAANVNGGAAAAGDVVRLQFRFLSGGETKAHTFATQDTLATVRSYVNDELLPSNGQKDFTLATVYPRREFAAEDDEKTLLSLGLFPSAVILVIVKESTTPASIIKSHGGIVNIFSSLIWSVLTPIFSMFNYLRGTLFNRGNNNNNNDDAVNDDAAATSGAQKRANEDSPVQADAAKRRNLDRFLTGPSTSREAGFNNTPQDDLTDQHNDQKPYRRYGASNVHRLSDKRKDSDDENATWNGNSTQQQ